ncbi:MAG: D-Ala-D-Ala carboxypeptidase family metallohydrolase [Hyphomicrobiaceae bacterium]
MTKLALYRSSQRIIVLLAFAMVIAFSAGVVVPQTAHADSAGEWLGKSFPSKLGGPSRAEGGGNTRRGPKGVQVASLGGSYVPKPATGPSLSGGVTWVASSGCLNSTLRSAISTVASNYGKVTVSSTCRSHSHNARVGGAPKSHHLTGDAADFRVHGNYGAAYAYLRSNGSLGGVKHYGGGLFHIDTGPKRSW